MTDELTRSAGRFLERLDMPVSAETLAVLCEGFGLDSRTVDAAAAELEVNHDLKYSGVRGLIGACLAELTGALLSEDGRTLVEVSVPSPLCLVTALSCAAKGRARFATSALLAQAFLRGLMLDSRPLDFTSCAKRRCGLNKMRERLVMEPVGRAPDMTLQFGSLCDECVKTGELLSAGVPAVSCTLPRSGPERLKCTRALLERTAQTAASRLGVTLTDSDMESALDTYSRLMRVQARLALLNSRRGRTPLYGNSFALAQSVTLMCFDDWEAPLGALETLAHELESAPDAESGRKRLYCFYVPFTRPGIDARFRANGVDLMGSAAFLTAPQPKSADIYELSARALTCAAPALDVKDEARLTASAAKAAGCTAYLTGSFSFDRRMGSAVPMLRKVLLEDYGLPSYSLESDFWCESGSPMPPNERIDAICDML